MEDKNLDFQTVKKYYKEYISFLKKVKLYFILASLLGGILGVIIVKTSTPKYNAHLTFLVNDAKGISQNPLAALASQYGAISSGISLSDERIMFLIPSKKILGQSLLTKLNDQDLTLADKFIEIFELKKNWGKDTCLVKFSKFENLKIEKLNYAENKVIDILIRVILKSKDLQFESIKKKSTSLVSQTTSGIIAIEFKSVDEIVSKVFVESIYNNLNEFYTQTITQSLKSNLDMVTKRADSTKRIMLLKEFETADELDITNNVIKYKAKVNAGRLRKDAEMLNLLYSELIKNKEIAKFNYDQEKPVFQVIDGPTFPLEELNKSLIIYVIGCVLIFIFFTLLIITFIFMRTITIENI